MLCRRFPQTAPPGALTAAVPQAFHGRFFKFLPHWLSLSLRPAGLPQLVKSKHVTALDCNSQDLMYATCGCAPRPVNYIKPIKKRSAITDP